MSTSQNLIQNGASNLVRLVVLSACGLSPIFALGQMPMSAPPAPNQTMANPDTSAQIRQLQQQVVQLQTAVKQSKGKKGMPQSDPMKSGKPAMGMGDDAGEMGGMPSDAAKPPMKDKMGGMGKMAPPASSIKGSSAAPVPAPSCCAMSMGMPMGKGGMADDTMGKMPSGGAASMKAKPMATPKMAEAPHLLHIGAKDFFLDHEKHLALTPDQKEHLATIKRNSANLKSTSEGQIATAQEQLWQLTSADQPNSADIDGKVQEVAQLRAAEQVAFIHSVSAASEVLTPEQRLEAETPMKLGKSSTAKMPKAPATAPMKMQ